MRGMRNALWALGLAGAAYAWKNRDKLQRQTNSFVNQPAPHQLPDYHTNSGNQPGGSSYETANRDHSEPVSINRGGTAYGSSDT